MDATNHGGTNGLAISLGTAAAATGASMLPQLTDGIRLLTAVVGLAAACVALYKALRKS
jgi:acetyl-CoA acetyltransferase